MERALLAALLCATAASATRYADYSGVKMPQYAGEYDTRDHAPFHPSEDYHGRSPDSPASLDYKYEEQHHVKPSKTAIDMDELDEWHKPARKQRGLAPSDTDILEALDKHNFDVEEPSKLKQSHRINQHRSRLKSNMNQPRGEQPRRQRHGRRRDDVSDRNDYLLDKDEFQDIKSKDFDDDISPFSPKATERVIRRKARDRFPKSRTQSLVEDEDLFVERQTVEVATKMDYDDDRRRKKPFERKDPFEDVIDLDDESDRTPLDKEGMKPYPDYNDNFYDMRRVQNIRDKLPSLLRRTSPRVRQPTLTARSEWSYRRAFQSPEIPMRRTEASSTSTVTTTTQTLPTETTTVTTSININTTVTNSSKELSLAEKSRLSILRKAQKKEANAEQVTRKPPVLMQVTKQMPTVVMVEPPASRDPWMRAREVSDESPERLEKVKKLMRKKLVAGARNIHDLTDNWDELICDYLDVSLLDDSVVTHTISSSLTIIIVVLYLFVL